MLKFWKIRFHCHKKSVQLFNCIYKIKFQLFPVNQVHVYQLIKDKVGFKFN